MRASLAMIISMAAGESSADGPSFCAASWHQETKTPIKKPEPAHELAQARTHTHLLLGLLDHLERALPRKQGRPLFPAAGGHRLPALRIDGLPPGMPETR